MTGVSERHAWLVHADKYGNNTIELQNVESRRSTEYMNSAQNTGDKTT